MERLPLYQIAIRRMEISLGEYIIRFVFPSLIIGLLLSVVLYFSLNSLFIGASGIILLILFPLLSAILAVVILASNIFMVETAFDANFVFVTALSFIVTTV